MSRPRYETKTNTAMPAAAYIPDYFTRTRSSSVQLLLSACIILLHKRDFMAVTRKYRMSQDERSLWDTLYMEVRASGGAVK
jgi:hypothetical protein